MTFLWCSFGFRKWFGAASQSSHWAGHRQLSYKMTNLFNDTFRRMLRSDREMVCRWRRAREDDTSERFFFFFLFLVSPQGTHLLSFFTLPICFKCWMAVDGRRWVLCSLLCSYKSISSDDCSQLVIVSFWWPSTTLIFKALISFAKLLEPSLHCMFISNSWAKCVVDVVSCLHCFTTHFELELKLARICCLSNIISIV